MSRPVFFGVPRWEVNGVNRFHAALVPELNVLGLDARILFTLPGAAPPPPPGVPAIRLPVSVHDGWPLRWQKLARFLEDQAPCVYLPGYDEAFSQATARLSPRVAVVAAVHSDDPVHYAHAARVGPWCRRVVAVSRETARKTALLAPALADRIIHIPYGVAPMPPRPPRPAGAPLSLVYAGRLEETQKRVSGLAAVAWGLSEARVPFSMTILGDGPARESLAARLGPLAADGPVCLKKEVGPEEVARAFLTHDVFLLPSAFEGLPLALLEAMAAGCVPVAAKVESGVPEAVIHGENGLLVPEWTVSGLIRTFSGPFSDPARLARLSAEARRTVETRFSLSASARAYQDLLSTVLSEAEGSSFVRPQGPMALPPGIRFSRFPPLAALQKNPALQLLKSRVLDVLFPPGRP